MEKKTYTCDGGSLAIGTVNARASFPNCFGDGAWNVYLYGTGEELPPHTVFRGAVEGNNIQVFAYDCYSNKELKDLIEDGTTDVILFELKGRFGVFAIENSGDMILQRWE